MPNARIKNRISTAELERRWSLLRVAMRERNLQALVLQNNNDWLGGYVKWLTDIPAQNGYPRSVVFHADEPMSIVEMGAFNSRRELTGQDEIHRGVGAWRGTPSFSSVAYTQDYDARLIAENLLSHGYARIGFVGPGAMPHQFIATIRAMLDGKTAIADATEFFDIIKAVKSDEEIEKIEAVAALQDEVFAHVLEAIRPGMRDADVTGLAQYKGQTLGSEQGIFLGGSSPVGIRSSFVGSHLQNRVLQKNDHLSLLLEINGAGGFYTEIARTIVLGRASNELQDGFAAVQAAQQHTLSIIKPGAHCAAIAAAHDSYMQAHHLPPETRLYAHGQGYDMVERPLIRHDETMQLAAGMCLAIHPGFETDSMFAVICDNYMVTDAGVSDCLHKTEKKIFEIP